ncbi:MAG TPA: hypothetical protein VG738_10995 [Chitinophagaceae bacterium]|nr:hypothetical protein [Chitinophagaceae bacterium]
MKFIVAILLTAALGFAAPLYLPWWSFAFTSALVALAVHQKAWKAFVAGFAGLFLLWGCLAFFIDMNNNHLMLNKIAGIFGLSGFLLIIITGIVGGLVSGFAALTGSFARRLR